MGEDVDRFKTPLYRVSEAATYLHVPRSTFDTWVHGYERRPPGRSQVVGKPVVTSVPPIQKGDPVVPFIGLAEGLVLAAFRRVNVPLRRIRPALDRLDKDFGLKHVLASQRLYVDGAEVLYDFAAETGDTASGREVRKLLAVARTGQYVFNDVVLDYLQRLEFGSDGYAKLIRLPQYEQAEVVADPRRSFGKPIFAHGGAQVSDVLGLVRAGEPVEVAAAEYGVPIDELKEALRVAGPQLAA